MRLSLMILHAMISASASQELPISELPGVGWATERKLESMGVATVSDVVLGSREALVRELGPGLGASLWELAHGRDSRRVEPPKPRKSVGAEVNWGIRFGGAALPISASQHAFIWP